MKNMSEACGVGMIAAAAASNEGNRARALCCHDVGLRCGGNDGGGGVIKSVGICPAGLYSGNGRVSGCFPGVKQKSCLASPLFSLSSVRVDVLGCVGSNSNRTYV